VRGGKRDTMARRMQAIDRAVAEAWREDFEAQMSKKDVSARIRMTAEEVAASKDKPGAWADAIEGTLKKVFDAEAVRWKDITRTNEAFWRSQAPSMTVPLRGESLQNVFVDEMRTYRPPERIIYQRQVPEEALVRAVDDMGARVRYLQERVDRMEAELDLLRIRAEKKRPDPPMRKSRAYGIK
jgi:hypothetical protein